MSNRFYTFVNQLISGSVAKASEVNSELQGTEVGFTTVEAELNTAIKFPATESAVNQRIVEDSAARAGKLLGFSAAGDLAVTGSFLGDWSMGGKRLRNVLDATEADEPVNLSQLSSYAAGLAGLPAIAGQSGCLVTDGATVTWGGLGRNVPSTATAYGGEMLSAIGGEAKWQWVRHNSVKDPNGVLGSGWWSTSLTRADDISGNYWSNNTTITGSTFEHKPVATAGYIPCGAGKAVAASCNVTTTAVSSGTISLVVRYYDAAYALISESAATTITNGASARQYALSVSTPPLTAYIIPVLKFAAVDALAYGIIVRNMKVEMANYASPFNDFRTLGLAYGASAQTYWGTGYTSPVVTIGDATSTLAVLDLRSAAGAQTYDCRVQSVGGTPGSVAKGAMYLYAQRVHTSGPIGGISEYAAGNSGAAITIDFGANGQYQSVVLNAATPAITISTVGLPVGKYQLKITQDGVGGRVPSWVGFVAATCVGNTLPTVASAANAVTFLSLYWDGAVWWVSANPWD